MKLLVVSIFALSILVGFSAEARIDDEFIASCEAYAEENDSEVNCTCLDEAAQEDPSLYEEFAKVIKPADAENMSEAAKEVVAQCAAE